MISVSNRWLGTRALLGELLFSAEERVVVAPVELCRSAH